MRHPDHLMIKDVRCFQGVQRARLRPITLLVGENSTGKTTFLACYSALHRMLGTEFEAGPLDFSREPFSMGSFRDIVRSRRGREGRIREFRIGFEMQAGDGIPAYEVTAEFREQGSQPVVNSWRYTFGSKEFLEFRRKEDAGTTVAIENYTTTLPSPFDLRNFRFLFSYDEDWIQKRFPDLEPVRAFVARLRNGRRLRAARREGLPFPILPPLIPVAPLRAKPHRTYDPIRETATPEGAHVPMLMMRLERSESERWKVLQDDLVAFGKESGLFSDIKVKRHGGQMSDPFQLQVKVHSGSYANIMDVGYGVSQSLPILVELLTAEVAETMRRPPNRRNSFLFLLQQPEVHLHPRGQAELASFFVNSTRQLGHRFLVETHSDYVVDRIRISVRQGLIPADQVSVLYFEPKGNSVNLHNLTLDNHGNIVNAPPGYRKFFFRETDRVLGLTE